MDSDLPSMDDMAEFEVSSPTVPAEKSVRRCLHGVLASGRTTSTSAAMFTESV